MTLRYFKPEDLKVMEAAVEKAERSTSGEIVTLILPEVEGYYEVSLAVGLGGALVGSLTAFIWHSLHPAWGLPFDLVLALPLLGFALGFLSTRNRPLLRRLARRAMGEAVHREALAHFTALGIARTRDRTGILLVISEREHRVELLADEGINAKHQDDFWKKNVDDLVTAIRNDKAAEGVVALIQTLASDLATHFPIKPDDTNELQNRILVGRQYA